MNQRVKASAPVLFIRVRCLPRLALMVLAAMAIQLALADSTYVVLLSDFHIREALAPLLPTAWGVLIGFALLRPQPELEMRHRRLKMARLTWVATLLTLCLVLTVPLAVVSSQSELAIMRNSLMMASMGVLGGVTLGAWRAWTPAVFTTSVCYFAGYLYESDSPHWWALPLQPKDNVSAAIATAVLTILAIGLYTLLDTRQVDGMPSAQ